MSFTSLNFLGFVFLIFLAILAGNRILKSDSQKTVFGKWVLLIGSYVFISWADLRFTLILMILTFVTWAERGERKYAKYKILILIITLIYFKYTNFFIASFSPLFGDDDPVVLDIILPLGISFYVFSAISYAADRSRGLVKKPSLLDAALYLSFFPKFTSEPIQRSSDFFDQINRPRKVGSDTLLEGAQIFAFGLFKKIVLADRLSLFVDQVYETPLAFSSGTVFLAVMSYSLQIYFDFSGYSDMAVGAAKALDIDLPRNFNMPYFSLSAAEFWKRWHITLSSWLKDYLYIPLGGNRKGKIRTYVNLVLTMVIGGLWHGPSWTYVLWGLFNGIGLAVHKIWMEKFQAKNENSFFSKALRTAMTFLFTSFCWIFFRSESLGQAFEIIKVMVFLRSGIWHPYVWFFAAAAVFAVSAAAAAIRGKGGRIDGYYPILDLRSFAGLTVFLVFLGLILGLCSTGGSPFIYGAY